MQECLSKQPVAIVGVACRLPGADNVEDFWSMLREGRSAVRKLPPERFDRELYYDPRRGLLNRSYTDIACLVDYRPMDRAVAPLPQSLAAHPEIAFTTLCEVSIRALRDAGLDPLHLPSTNVGVYVGNVRGSGLSGDLIYQTMIGEIAEYLREIPELGRLSGNRVDEVIRELTGQVRQSTRGRDRDGGPDLSANMSAKFTSLALGLTGPYMAFNAACASSMQALVQAVRALQLDRIDLALASGASYCHSDTLVLFSQAQSLSATGSRPWDAAADGMVVGEGYVTLVLKRLDRALADGDRICALVSGIGLSSDGKGKSLWAPRKEGQVQAMLRAYGDHLAMDRLQYIEAHATSTALGDVTEIEALQEALTGRLPPGQRIPIGSVKANIGHTLENAGLASVLKTVLAIQQATIPPVVNVTRVNPRIDWERLPFYLPFQAEAWERPPDGGPRRAAVNAFGIGGLNTHIVLDEYLPPARTAVVAGASHGPRREPSADARAVAVIGVGAVLPGARTIDAFWELLETGRDARSDAPAERWNQQVYYRPGQCVPGCCGTRRGGFIHDYHYDWRRHRVPPKQIEHASPLQFMILDAVDQALAQAGYPQRPFDRSRVGVVAGTQFGGEFSVQLQMGLRLPQTRSILRGILQQRGVAAGDIEQVEAQFERVLLSHMPALLDETGSFTSSSLASRITKSFDLMGGAVAVDGGSPSALAALSCCVDQLLSGDTDMMICVGGQQDMGVPKYEGWGLAGLLASDSAAPPLDAEAAGTLPGEGCGVLLLKRLEDARRDGDPVLGIIRGLGAGFSTDMVEAAQMAAERALEDSGLKPQQVTAVEIVGTGLKSVDAGEIEGLSLAYRSAAHGPPKPLGTVVSQIGHTGGASGAAAMLKSLRALENLEVTGIFGLGQTAEEVAAFGWLLRPDCQKQPIPVVTADGRVFAAVEAGGGHEAVYHVILERGAKVRLSTEVVGGNGSPSAAVPGRKTEIVHFDATQRRRERMRGRGRYDGEPVSQAVPPASETAATGSAAKLAEPPPVTAPPSTPPQPASRRAGRSADELQAFLVNFVVEQTGYPPDIVELDADLEADLGIDSIKKAQLFGELREYVSITTPRDDLTLDDFPTLRHVMDFILQAERETAAATVLPSAPTAAPSATVGSASGGTSVQVSAVPASLSAAAPSQSETSAIRSPQGLQHFLVNFVVEQTGYPPEIVELDADLEADLGIDSIKKAQLFGELGEHFAIKPQDDLTLDDFPTLRHVMVFIEAQR